MWNNVRVGSMCVLLALAVTPPSLGQALTPLPFSANLGFAFNNGTKETGKFYFAPPKMRIDTAVNGQTSSVIADGETILVVIHEHHAYMEFHSNRANAMQQTQGIPTYFDPAHPCGAAASCKSLGTEIVNGRVCDKYQGAFAHGNKLGTVWVDQRLHFPIKGVSAGTTYEFTDIVEGSPDASLFQLPAGYQKVTIPRVTDEQPPQ